MFSLFTLMEGGTGLGGVGWGGEWARSLVKHNGGRLHRVSPVSYTHLTLPTIVGV